MDLLLVFLSRLSLAEATQGLPISGDMWERCFAKRAAGGGEPGKIRCMEDPPGEMIMMGWGDL